MSGRETAAAYNNQDQTSQKHPVVEHYQHALETFREFQSLLKQPDTEETRARVKECMQKLDADRDFIVEKALPYAEKIKAGTSSPGEQSNFEKLKLAGFQIQAAKEYVLSARVLQLNIQGHDQPLSSTDEKNLLTQTRSRLNRNQNEYLARMDEATGQQTPQRAAQDAEWSGMYRVAVPTEQGAHTWIYERDAKSGRYQLSTQQEIENRQRKTVDMPVEDRTPSIDDAYARLVSDGTKFADAERRMKIALSLNHPYLLKGGAYDGKILVTDYDSDGLPYALPEGVQASYIDVGNREASEFKRVMLAFANRNELRFDGEHIYNQSEIKAVEKPVQKVEPSVVKPQEAAIKNVDPVIQSRLETLRALLEKLQGNIDDPALQVEKEQAERELGKLEGQRWLEVHIGSEIAKLDNSGKERKVLVYEKPGYDSSQDPVLTEQQLQSTLLALETSIAKVVKSLQPTEGRPNTKFSEPRQTREIPIRVSNGKAVETRRYVVSTGVYDPQQPKKSLVQFERVDGSALQKSWRKIKQALS